MDWAAGGEPWNAPTSHRLEPLTNHTFGFRIFTAPSIRERDAWLSKAGKAVAHGVPGAPIFPPQLHSDGKSLSCSSFSDCRAEHTGGIHCLVCHHENGLKPSRCTPLADVWLQYTLGATVEGLSIVPAKTTLCVTGLWCMAAGFTLAANDEAMLLVSLPGDSSESAVQEIAVQEIAVIPESALSISAPEAAGYHCSR